MAEGGGVELYSDFACPFCYLAEAGAAGLERGGSEIAYRAFELRPAPIPLEAPSSDALKRSGWDHVIAPLASEAGLDMRLPNLGVRTRKAHEAAKHAKQHGVEREMRDALFAAYFRDGQDIGRIDVLVALGEKLGLDRTEMKVTLDIDQHTDAVVAEEAEAVRLGLSGVPAYVRDNGRDIIVGLQDPKRLIAWMEKIR